MVAGLVATLFPPWRSHAATTNGHVVAWATNACFSAAPSASLSNLVAVAAGNCYAIALRHDGTVVGWGDDFTGQLAPPPGLAGVRAVAGGLGHFLALRSNGTLVAWGDFSLTNAPSGLADVKAIAAGHYHSLALRSNGTVVAWGTGMATNVPTWLNDAVAVAGGGAHSLALRAGGTVVAWGNNGSGQLNVPLGLQNVVAVAAGGAHSLALLNNGTVVGWGAGQSAYPWQSYPPPGLSRVTAIAAGNTHSLALRSDFTVVGWGDPYDGKTATSWLSNVVALSTTYDQSLALIVDPPTIPPAGQPVGRNVMIGQGVSFTVSPGGSPPFTFQWRKDGTNVPGATNSVHVIGSAQLSDAGGYSVVVSNLTGWAASTNATLVVNAPPSITNQPASRSVLAGASQVSFTVGASGTAPLRYQWRKDGTKLNDATNATYSIYNVQLSHAGDYTVVVTNSFGAVTSAVATLTVNTLPVITNQPRSQTVFLGASAVFSVGASNATGYQWRKDNVDLAGANGPSHTIPRVQSGDAGEYRVVVSNPHGATLSDIATLTVVTPPPGATRIEQYGETLVWNGFDYVDLTPPPGLANVRAFAVGPFHTLALLTDGSVIGWGDNSHRQAAPPAGLRAEVIAAGGFHSLALTNGGRIVGWGRNDAGQSTPPPSASNAVAVAAGGFHSLALRRDGTIVGWGSNQWGQATLPSGNSNFMAVAAGWEHSLGLRSNGTVVAWGRNLEYQTRVPANLTNSASASVKAIAAGAGHNLALRSNGTVIAWGLNDSGQTNVPPGLSNVIAIAAGDRHSLALKSDGTVVGWGLDSSGQITFPPGLSGVSAIAAGGNRSLLLVKKHFILLAPARGSKQFSFLVAHDDLSPIDSARLSQVEVRAGTNLVQPVTNWSIVTNGLTLLSNGLLRVEATNILTWPRRFYRVGERP